VETWPPDTPILAGQAVAVVACLFGLWWLNACRIVYVVDEQGPVQRFGFAYGTLPDHAESGEERFTVSRHEAILVRVGSVNAFEPCVDLLEAPKHLVERVVLENQKDDVTDRIVGSLLRIHDGLRDYQGLTKDAEADSAGRQAERLGRCVRHTGSR
jgi:hypothetical protein